MVKAFATGVTEDLVESMHIGRLAYLACSVIAVSSVAKEFF